VFENSLIWNTCGPKADRHLANQYTMVAACSRIVDTKNLLYRTVSGKHEKDQDVGQTIIPKPMLKNRFSG